MRGRFPKFFKENPRVLGLGPSELLILVVGLLSSQIIFERVYLGLLLTILALATHKILSRFVDYQGLILGMNKKKSLEWEL